MRRGESTNSAYEYDAQREKKGVINERWNIFIYYTKKEEERHHSPAPHTFDFKEPFIVSLSFVLIPRCAAKRDTQKKKEKVIKNELYSRKKCFIRLIESP